MKKKLYLHIGYNKTGSSYIQKCLVDNAEALSARGYFYPCTPGAAYLQATQHVPLAAALTGRPVYWLVPGKRNLGTAPLDEFLEAARQSDCPNIVLSSEAFGDIEMGREDTRRIAEALAEFDVRIVAYIRRQDDYMLSSYQQDIKVGGIRPFSLEARLEMPQNRFAQRLALWQEAFGRENVVVRLFDRKKWAGGDLFLDFLDAIGCPDGGMELAAPENEGMDYREANLLLSLNQALVAMELPKRRRDAVRAVVRKRIRALKPFEGRHEKLALSNEAIETIRDYYLEENRRILDPADLDGFILPRPGGRSNVDDTRLDQELATQLIADLAVKLTEGTKLGARPPPPRKQTTNVPE